MTLGGGKRRKKAASKNFAGDRQKRTIQTKDEFQEYGIVEKMLGDMRCSVLCSDATVKTCHIRGKFKRRVWINVGDTVLISLREFEDGKADIVHKYTADEAEILKMNEGFDPNRLKNVISADVQNISILENSANDDLDEEINFDAI